jgi:hypothetical protein
MSQLLLSNEKFIDFRSCHDHSTLLKVTPMLSKRLHGAGSEFEGKPTSSALPAMLLSGILMFARASAQTAQSVILAWNASSDPNPAR